MRCHPEPVVGTDTNGLPTTNYVQVCITNRPWLGQTDSDNQVSGYSSRGNVGIGVEGPFGRFKPDVVAPGSMVVSARSRDYVEPEGATNTLVYQYNDVPFAYQTTNLFTLNIPATALEVKILLITNALSPLTNVDLLIGAAIDNIPTTFIASNQLTLNAASAPRLRAGTLYYTIGNLFYSDTAVFDLVVLLTVTNDVGDYFTVLKQLNAPLKPHYRYESGTSMAAPKISGMLALMQQYLTTNFNRRPSPALLKALLINGARSLSVNYNLDSHASLNHQGWGVASLSNSIPIALSPLPTNGPMRFFDQSVTNGLATGGTHVYQVTVPNAARTTPLRLSLVWSDPPGNPVAGIKLVNDLNLLVTGDVTNVLSGQTNSSSLVWVGNAFPPGSDFVRPLIAASTDPDAEVSTNLVRDIDNARDLVNNVENVYIQPPLSSSYTVVVKGHRVNVNALNSHSNNIAQDYALVISSGNVANTNINLTATGPVFTNDPSPRISVLARASNATTAALLNQRVGANAPLIVSTNGATNQWAFYTYTNVPTANFTNVVIFTFFPPELSLPRFREADIDLYVARGVNGTNLFVLDPATVSGAAKSTLRGGTEIVLFSNAQPNEVFSIGVKSEDQQAAQFNIFAASSNLPFSRRDSNNIVAAAFPMPVDIPDGTPDAPGGTNLFAIVFEPDVNVQRVYVTNGIFHEQGGDLIGILSHADAFDGSEGSVALNNHRTWNGLWRAVYDDSDQGDLGDPASTPPVIPPDGPGRLRDFVGQSAFGVWNFTVSDNALFHTGSVRELVLVIEPASTNADLPVDLTRAILPGRWVYAGFNVPADATNVQACVSYLSGVGPVELYLRRGAFPTRAEFDAGLTGIVPPGDCLNLGLNDSPPLSQGRYYVGVLNAGLSPVRIRLTVEVQRLLTPNRAQTIANNSGTFLIDDATTNSTIFVTNRGLVASVEVDVRLEHPRISDLALHLVSPQGARTLLAENRGHDTARGYGWTVSNIVVTNFGARVFDNGFEDAPQNVFVAGDTISGWRVDAGQVDLMTFVINTGSRFDGAGPHTGTNLLDSRGFIPGAISTNVTLQPGKVYQLSFAFCRNPDSRTVIYNNVVPEADIRLAGANLIHIYADQISTWQNMNWQTTSRVFRAAFPLNKLEIVSTGLGAEASGVMFDTIRIDEVERLTNNTLYATFTDDPTKAFIPIKFAPPPFGETNFTGTNLFVNGFENTTGGVYNAGRTFAGWTVRNSDVYVQSNNTAAYSDTNYVLLRTGTVSRVLPTVAGKEYVLQFASRTARRLIYNTGVDVDAFPLPGGSIDPHYFVSSNTFSRATNAAYVIQSNTTAFANVWVNGALPESRWIGLDANVGAASSNVYGFKTQFDLTGFNWRNVSLTGKFQVDGPTVAVLLNGANVPSALITTAEPSYRTGFVTRVFTNGFVAGMNTLELVVTNRPTNNGRDPCGIQAQFAPDAIRGSRIGALNFDALSTTPSSPGQYAPVPNGYGGLQWSNFGVLNGFAISNGYENTVVSPSNVAFNAYGNPASVSSSTPFNFDSAYFATQLPPPRQLTVQGYVGSVLVYSNNFTISNAPTRLALNLFGVTSVRFNPNRSSVWFTMDDASIDGTFPPVVSSIGQVKIVGSYTNYFTALSDAWRVQNVTFVARSNNATLEFSGITPGVWLDHILLRETGRKYYLPEEPLAPFVGQQSFGNWNLEVWDSRLGADVGARSLISWRLNLAYVRTNPPLTHLTNHVPYIGAISRDNLRYFVVNVPCGNALITNTLMSLTPPGALDLLFNQDTFPTGSDPLDVTLISNTTSNIAVLNVGLYPLSRTGPYFMAVRNTNPAQNNNFLLRVDIDCGNGKSAPYIVPGKVLFGPGSVTLQWTAEPYSEFRVEYTDDLTGFWMAFPDTIYSDTGEFSFTDDGSFSGTSVNRFYRLVLVQ